MPFTRRILNGLVGLPAEHLHFVSARCTRYRHRMSSCELCQEVCPSKAIKVIGLGIELEPAACISCGACATICPTQALQIAEPSPWELLEAGLERKQVDFCCRRAYRDFAGTSAISVECLAELDEAILLSLALRQTQAGEYIGSVNLYCGDCTDCPAGHVRALIDQVVEDCHKLAPEARISLSEGLPDALALDKASVKSAGKAAEGKAKRSAFLQLRHDAPASLAKLLHEPSTPSKQPRNAESRFQKFRPLRQLQLQLALGKRSADNQSRLWTSLDIDIMRCSNCQLCTKVCPTAALVLYHQASSQGIDFYPARCVNCKLCADCCIPHAITIKDGCCMADLEPELVYRFELRTTATSSRKSDKG